MKFRTRLADALPALALALAGALLLSLALARVGPFGVDLGRRDARFAENFHEPEPANAPRFRWTTGDSTLALPRPAGVGPAILDLYLLPGRPKDGPQARLRLSVGGAPVAHFATLDELNLPRAYHVLVPAESSFGWATRVGISSDTFTLPSDPRPLGVVVDRAALRPLAGAPPLPSPWLALWGAVLAALAYALPRSVGAGRIASACVAVGGAFFLALGVWLRPAEVLPFVARLDALLALGLLAVWLARAFARPVRDERGRLVIPGIALPLCFAAAWWMGPLFQAVMVADGATGIAPDTATLIIGGALALALLVGVGGWRWSRRGSPPAERDEGVRRIALGIVALGAAAHLVFMIGYAFTRGGPDFWLLFKGAREFARGGSLYDIAALTADPFSRLPLKVPPFYGMLFLPFVFRDGLEILFYHRVLNCVLLALAVIAWLRMWRIPPRSLAVAGVLVALNYRPIADTIAFGQIDIALLLVLALALWALRERRDLLAGVAVAFGTMFKIYPVLLLPFFVVKRRWYALAGWVLGMAALNGLALAVMGWGIHREFLFEVMPRIGGTTPWVENQAISGVLARLVAAPNIDSFRDPTVVMLANGLALAGLALVSALSLRPAEPTSARYALQYSQFLLLMVLVIPASWMHYETLLFVPFAALLLHWRDRPIDLRVAAVLALSFALTGFGNQWSFYGGVVTGVLTIAGISYKFFGMLLLGGVLVRTLITSADTADEHGPTQPIYWPLRPLSSFGVKNFRRRSGTLQQMPQTSTLLSASPAVRSIRWPASLRLKARTATATHLTQRP